MTTDNEDPPSTGPRQVAGDGGMGDSSHQEQNGAAAQVGVVQHNRKSVFDWLKSLFRGRQESSLRAALEEYLEESAREEEGGQALSELSSHEKTLLSNVLKLRGQTAADVMVPRADIVAVEIGTPHEDILALLREQPYSRIPVYQDNLDHVLGVLHIKDIVQVLAGGQKANTRDLIREVPIVSPSIPVLDLLLQMRQSRRHLAMVVDEYGGIDGLVTIGELVEAIVGEFADEHDNDSQPEIKQEKDGTVLADARVDIEEFEDRFGHLLSEEEREENETLGGLVFYIAGRVPARGEVLTHDTGMIFEVLDADPRRVNRLRIRNIPAVLGQ